jgi:hypothetical protein
LPKEKKKRKKEKNDLTVTNITNQDQSPNGGVAQGAGTELKPQHQKQNKQKKNLQKL